MLAQPPVLISLRIERLVLRASPASVMMKKTLMMMRKMFLAHTIPRITPI
jgi:hypothetical protein